MKVLYNERDSNFNRTKCKCGAVLEYNPLDFQKNILGETVIYCPECCEPIIVNRLTFPNDFFNYSGGENITDEKINLWIEDCINKCRDGNMSSVFQSGGNSIVFVFNGEENYEIYVAKNYYETEIKK